MIISNNGSNHSAFSWWTQHEGCSSVQMEVQRSNPGQSSLLREERPHLESGFWQRSKSRRPNCSGFFSSELALKQILDLDGIAVSVANPWTSKEVCVALNAGSMPITNAPLSATPATYLPPPHPTQHNWSCTQCPAVQLQWRQWKGRNCKIPSKAPDIDRRHTRNETDEQKQDAWLWVSLQLHQKRSPQQTWWRFGFHHPWKHRI